jgi:peptidoglycan/xylan/chitin deacetylase (PgdA/CDA1 family)
VKGLVLVTAVFALAALAAYPFEEVRVAAWIALGVGYLGVGTWGTTRMSSGLFGRAHTRAPAATNKVALTWDDGPDPRSTPPLLDLLKSRGVRGSFFCVGERARTHPEIVRRCQAEGHLLANHSDRHSLLTNFYFGAAMRREMSACQDTLVELGGVAPRYYRPPMGYMNHAVEGAAASLNMELVGWHTRGWDTTGRPVEDIVKGVLDRVEPGAIVLLHDGHQDPDRVVAIACGVLDGLEARGLEPARLDALLGHGAGTPNTRPVE